MRRLDIGLDLDGVMYDFDNTLKHYLVEYEGFDPDTLPLPPLSWNFYKDQWGMTDEEFVTHCVNATNRGVMFKHGEPFEDVVEVVNRLRDNGHRIHIITNRSFGEKAHHNTSDWLREYGIPFDSLIFAKWKPIVRPDVMLDDYARNYTDMWDAGVETWLFDRPWNQDFETEYRVFGWLEFEQVIERKANAS